ncbi:unnamed protein product [Caenorhabditis angaria]|uniref:AMP-activated protein kinase glycogen-binding domain-containing protein n=1 Tax=Caenorhabditis angaria TaxID=860376 RepID=A0A9P1IQK9_9PELO|nr:unnamed protein product [Caenorhabditis angaria]
MAGSYLKPFKQFLQWTLGCTYAKKSMRNRIRDMFYFTEAPHVVIYEINENEPWWKKVGLIFCILITVMLLYYLLEMAFQTARRMIRNFFASLETHSTISTPRCLSPRKSLTKIKSARDVSVTKTSRSNSRNSTPSKRHKIRMNEPVNCVFIRPSSHKLHSTSPVHQAPTPAPIEEKEKPIEKSSTPPKASNRPSLIEIPKTPDRGKSGADIEISENSPIRFQVGNIMEWLASQNLETESDQESFIIKAPTLISPISITENVSEISASPSVSSSASNWTEKYAPSEMAKSIISSQDDFDIVIDDNPLFSDNLDENVNFGKVLVKNGQSKVLFRWTDDNPKNVQKIELSGSFFGWKMSVPMRQDYRNSRIFTANLELPEGLHEYRIKIDRVL